MSERPPEGRDTQTIPPTSVEVADEVLAGHLRRRGARTAPRTLTAAILTRVDETAPQRRWRLTLAAWRPRMAVAVSGLTLALVAGLLYVNTTPAPIGTDRWPSPSAVPTSAAGPGVAWWDPTQRALTPPELLRILATGPAPGTTLIVDDGIAKLDPTCPPQGTCYGKLVNARVDVEPLIGGHLPFDGPSDIPGPLALQITTGPNLDFLGSVVSNGTRMGFQASDLLKRSAMGGLFVVPAWLWATPPAPCPSMPGTPAPMPTSELGLPAPRLACFPTDWLTDTGSTNPAHGGIGFPVQHGAYGAFAVYPGGTVDQTNPSSNIYLVRDWAGYGEILARLEPLSIPSDEAIGPTSEPTVGPSPSAPGIVMSAEELVARVLDGTLKAGSLAVASIPESAVKVLPPAADVAPKSRWTIVSGSRSVRVDGVVSSGLVGIQAFVVQPTGTILALGTVSTGPSGAALDGTDVLPIPDGLSAVHGWLRVGPPLPCPKSASGPGPSGVPGKIPTVWSQCPGVWILPSDVDPWAGPPNNVQATDGSGSMTIGDPSVPKGTLHVQDGAPGADGPPREGDWLVRVAKTNPCQPWMFCAFQLDPQPPPGVTWYELVGAITAPDAVAVAPLPPAVPLPPGTVLTQDALIAAVTSGSVPIGSVVIATATIAPVILPSFPPDAGTVTGKIGPLRVHWASDPSLQAADLQQIALRIRPDGELDYLGPVDISNTSSYGSTNGLFLVETSQGPILLRRIDCDAPATIKVCPIANADAQTVTLDPVFVPASVP
jgi:hypothetical protein